MPSRPSFQDRVLKRAVPRVLEAYRPPPQQLAPGLWSLDRQLVHFGAARLPSRTTLVRLADGSLVVISPPAAVDDDTAAAIERIGRVAYVVLPNAFHYLYAPALLARYPAAALLAAPGMRTRVPELPIESELDADPPEAWSGVLELVVLGPVRGIAEVLFFHRPTGTLVLTDLAFNMVRYPRPIDRLIWRLSGIPGGLGPGRTTRSLLLRDRAVAARALTRAMEWPIERIVVAHGDVVDRDARSRLATAFSGHLDPAAGDRIESRLR